MPKSYPSSFRCASYLVYSPRGTSDLSRKSRKLRDAIKKATPGILEAIVAKLAALLVEDGDLAGFFGDDVALVPVPRSAPLVRGGLWPADRICRELLRAGLGGVVLPVLHRVEAVPKSAYARKGERPTAGKHRETMNVEPELGRPRQILAVDDFVTIGRTVHASMDLLSQAYPDAEVRGFALVRTMGREEVENVFEPWAGTMTLRRNGWIDRGD